MTALHLDCSGRRGDFTYRLNHTLPLDGITALFGPSGCGKTTALRAIAGLEDACQGRIALGDHVWCDSATACSVPAHRRGIGYVFQDARLFDHLNVDGNLHYAERRAAAGGPAVARNHVVKAFAIDGLLHRQVADLSGGERQRIAIARALLSRPRLLLMDEPLSALDIPRRAEIMGYIEALPALFGIPVIYVTHAIDEVARLASHLALMDSGQIVASGPVQEVLARLDLPPLTGRFEAGAVLEGQVVSQDEDYALTMVDIGGQVLMVPQLNLQPGEDLRLRVRARDVAISFGEPHNLSIRNILTATIAEIAAEPGTAFAEIRLSLESQDLRARITRKAVDELHLKPGLEVHALIKAVTLDRRMLTPVKR